MPECDGRSGVLACDYLSIHGLSDDAVAVLEGSVRAHARQLGLSIVAIFTEHDRGSQIAFGDLIEAVARELAGHVIVPDLDHLSPRPLLRALMVARLHRETGAHIHPAQPRPRPRSPAPA